MKSLIKEKFLGILSFFRPEGRMKLTCPICGFTSSRFKDYTGSYYIMGELVDHFTKNALCPSCGSDIRHRFIYKFLSDRTDIFNRELRLLHFAPEEWLASKLMACGNIEYVSGDIDYKAYAFAGAIYLDNTKITFEHEYFDALVSIHVLEHITDDIKAVSEIYRVLKKGGWALIAVPVYGEKTYEDTSLDAEGRTRMYGIDEHVRMNGLDFAEKLAGAGFDVRIVSLGDIDGGYYNPESTSPHIESDRYLFYCTKRT